MDLLFLSPSDDDDDCFAFTQATHAPKGSPRSAALSKKPRDTHKTQPPGTPRQHSGAKPSISNKPTSCIHQNPSLCTHLLSLASSTPSLIDPIFRTLAPDVEENPTRPAIFRHDIPRLKRTIAELISFSQQATISSLAPRTLSTYRTAWNSFRSFHATLNLPFPSFDVASVCSFISHVHSVLHIEIPTIKIYLSGINFFAKLLTGSPATLSQSSLLIKGLQPPNPTPTPRRLPLTTDLISRCIATLRSNHFSAHLARTLESMFLLAFFGFLRCSEFASSSAKFNPSLHPCVSDLYPISEDCLGYSHKRSKTNQLRKMQQTSSHDVRHQNRPRAATIASSRGVPDHLIMVMGRWSSQADQLYTRHSFDDLR
ncbi:LOW QUALITY PROTEIN: uncharacterized protein [Embiotoca jacksoni]|uniref:LOW QUALITY PROTEIN: uncharacterized protein n=1 Tax=Embiotoca jacksoni TaxID=100190 RepID=UPI0037047F2E